MIQHFSNYIDKYQYMDVFMYDFDVIMELIFQPILSENSRNRHFFPKCIDIVDIYALWKNIIFSNLTHFEKNIQSGLPWSKI